MNDEIKKILECMKQYGSTSELALLDYITNLQQENEYLKKQNDEKTKIGIADHKYASQMEDKVIELQQEIARLEGENIEIRQCLLIKRRSIPHKLTMDKSIEEILDMPTYEDYKSRCEKATEITENLLKTEKSGYYQIIFKQQLNILQNGSEKDDR